MLDIRQEVLVSNEWGFTQDLGRAARRAGFDALIVPSAAGDHHNLVVFNDLLRDDEIAETERVDRAPSEP
ncbi:MAG: RES family NAD+ phosphorylase [bacterium]